MLLENLWIVRLLVNGNVDMIDDIIWEEGADWKSDLSLAICVAFDGYTGPVVLYHNDAGQSVVPIFRSTHEFFQSNTTYTRTQFSLSIAFAITIHKAQGITLEQAILDISGTEFTIGLNYIAVSRIKTKEGLLFDIPFDYNIIRRKPGLTMAARLDDWDRRISQVIQLLRNRRQLLSYLSKIT